MISAEQARILTATSDRGMLLLFLTVGAALLTLALVRRTIPFNIHLPSMALPKLKFAISLNWLLLLALIVRLPRMFDSAWYDEMFTARIVSLPLQNLPAAILGDVHPPLSYLISWLAVHLFGSSEFVLRLPSLLFGVLSVVLVYRVVLALALEQRVALTAAAIAAVLPTWLYYSNEARMYALLLYLVLYSFLALLKDRPKTFMIVCAGVVLTHNIGVVYAGVLSMLALAQYRSRWIKPVVVVGLVAALWLPVMIYQSHDVADGFWLKDLTLGGFISPVVDTTAGVQLPEMLVLPVYVPIIAISILSLYEMRRWLSSGPGLTAAWLMFGVPALVALASLLWGHSVYLSRALLPSAAPLVTVWAWTMICSARRWLYWLLIALALALGLVGFYSSDVSRPDVRAWIADGCAGTNAAYATGIPAAIFTAYYLPGHDLLLWPGAGDLNQTLPPEAVRAMELYTGQLENLRHRRVCLVVINTPFTTDKERTQIGDILANHPPITARRIPVNITYELNLYILET